MGRLLASAVVTVLMSACLGNDFQAAPPVIDGIPDCTSSRQWATELALSPDAAGLPTAEAALREFLFDYQRRFSGRILIRGESASFIVDGREGLVATAVPAPAGGWLVVAYQGCEGFEDVDDVSAS